MSTPNQHVLGDFLKDLGEEAEADIAAAFVTWLRAHPAAAEAVFDNARLLAPWRRSSGSLVRRDLVPSYVSMRTVRAYLSPARRLDQLVWQWRVHKNDGTDVHGWQVSFEQARDTADELLRAEGWALAPGEEVSEPAERPPRAGPPGNQPPPQESPGDIEEDEGYSANQERGLTDVLAAYTQVQARIAARNLELQAQVAQTMRRVDAQVAQAQRNVDAQAARVQELAEAHRARAQARLERYAARDLRSGTDGLDLVGEALDTALEASTTVLEAAATTVEHVAETAGELVVQARTQGRRPLRWMGAQLRGIVAWVRSKTPRVFRRRSGAP